MSTVIDNIIVSHICSLLFKNSSLYDCFVIVVEGLVCCVIICEWKTSLLLPPHLIITRPSHSDPVVLKCGRRWCGATLFMCVELVYLCAIEFVCCGKKWLLFNLLCLVWIDDEGVCVLYCRDGMCSMYDTFLWMTDVFVC